MGAIEDPEFLERVVVETRPEAVDPLRRAAVGAVLDGQPRAGGRDPVHERDRHPQPALLHARPRSRLPPGQARDDGRVRDPQHRHRGGVHRDRAQGAQGHAALPEDARLALPPLQGPRLPQHPLRLPGLGLALDRPQPGRRLRDRDRRDRPGRAPLHPLRLRRVVRHRPQPLLRPGRHRPSRSPSTARAARPAASSTSATPSSASSWRSTTRPRPASTGSSTSSPSSSRSASSPSWCSPPPPRSGSRSRSTTSRTRGSRPRSTTTTRSTPSCSTSACEPSYLGDELVRSMLKTIERAPRPGDRLGDRSADPVETGAASRPAPAEATLAPRALGYHRRMRAADALMEALKAEGTQHIFGIPGGANLPIYDAVHDADITHIQARHEQGAGHMAEGYAKASGRVGVAFATSGPGATNLVTPIADAIMDSVPTVFITGQVRTELIGTDGFQEADVNGITMPIVKHSLHGPGPAPHPGLRPRGVPHRLHRAPRAGARRRSAGPLPGGHRVRADHRDPESARLQALHRGEHQADPDRRQGARQRSAAGDLRRRRRDQRQCLGGAARALPLRQLPRHLHGDGPRRLPGAARAVARDARHARHPHRQLLDGQRRPDRRDRRPLRRPDHRQALRVRAAGQVRPHRHRPRRDLEERPGPHPDRRRRQGGPAQADQGVPRRARRTAVASTPGGTRSTPGRRSTRSPTRTPRTPRSSRSG